MSNLWGQPRVEGQQPLPAAPASPEDPSGERDGFPGPGIGVGPPDEPVEGGVDGPSVGSVVDVEPSPDGDDDPEPPPQSATGEAWWQRPADLGPGDLPTMAHLDALASELDAIDAALAAMDEAPLPAAPPGA